MTEVKPRDQKIEIYKIEVKNMIEQGENFDTMFFRPRDVAYILDAYDREKQDAEAWKQTHLEYKTHYDRLFASGVLIPSNDYSSLIDQLHAEKDRNRVGAEQLLQAKQELEAAKHDLEAAKVELAFTKQYLNPVDISFRTMIDAFKEFTPEQKDKIINLAKSLKELNETK